MSDPTKTSCNTTHPTTTTTSCNTSHPTTITTSCNTSHVTTPNIINGRYIFIRSKDGNVRFAVNSSKIMTVNLVKLCVLFDDGSTLNLDPDKRSANVDIEDLLKQLH